MVARLKAAGAIMVGKTNTPTLGWIGATHNLLFGVTRNPWNLDRTPGGSTGGAAAAVAAGLGPLAVGTDGGGSIRIPASFAGSSATSRPTAGGRSIPSGAWSLSHIGPMTRTVADAALMMNVCAGPSATSTRCPGTAWTTSGAPRESQGAARRVQRHLGFAPAVDPRCGGDRARGAGVSRARLPGGGGRSPLAVARGVLALEIFFGGIATGSSRTWTAATRSSPACTR